MAFFFSSLAIIVTSVQCFVKFSCLGCHFCLHIGFHEWHMSFFPIFFSLFCLGYSTFPNCKNSWFIDAFCLCWIHDIRYHPYYPMFNMPQPAGTIWIPFVDSYWELFNWIIGLCKLRWLITGTCQVSVFFIYRNFWNSALPSVEIRTIDIL